MIQKMLLDEKWDGFERRILVMLFFSR